jgi:molybdopterin synthase sulfur carrier subunit
VKHTVHVQYFAVLREQAGRGEESCVTTARTAAALYEELRAAHGLGLPREMLRVAVNDEFASWDRPLAEGDRVVFIPPVAGG